ncbi:MAG: hypothetical protein MZU91_14710 [Desulfosudis oleivorans]|nr:hypothetical protein [Desulfosudis oleivorans]
MKGYGSEVKAAAAPFSNNAWIERSGLSGARAQTSAARQPSLFSQGRQGAAPNGRSPSSRRAPRRLAAGWKVAQHQRFRFGEIESTTACPSDGLSSQLLAELTERTFMHWPNPQPRATPAVDGRRRWSTKCRLSLQSAFERRVAMLTCTIRCL